MLIGAGIGIPFQQNVLARLLGSAEFFAPLTHSAIPTRAASGTTGTFTRATTKTVENNDGYLVTLLAGEIGFPGARRVRNLVTGSSENWTNAYYTKAIGGTGVLPAVTANYVANPVNGAVTASRVVLDIGAGTTGSDFSRIYNNGGISHAASSLRTLYVKSNTQNSYVINWGLSGSMQLKTVTPEWTRLTSVVANSYPDMFLIGNLATSKYADISVFGEMVEDITGRTDQTTPSEYVSVGVESAPYYHGSFVDGVKCFPTDLSGNLIPSTTLLGYQAQGARTNLALQSNAFTTTWTAYNAGIATQNVVGPDGYTSAWTLTDNSAVAAMGVIQSIALTAATHTVSAFVKKTVGAQSSYPVIYLDDSVSKGAACTIDTTNGVATVWTAYTGLTIVTSSASCVSYNEDYWRVSLVLLATAATWTLYLLPAATTNATQSTGVWDVAAQGSAVFYGAQVELGSFASSYIPTTTAAVTRNADVLTYSSAGNLVGGAYWLYTEASSNETSTNFNIVGRDVATGNKANLMYVASDTLRSYIGDGVHGSQSLSAALGSPFATPKKFVTTGSANSVFGAVNGVVGTEDTTQTAVNFPTNIAIGCTDGGSYLFGNIGPIYIGQRQLSASEMQAVTS